jgi:lambda family phage minor tail protein L
LTIEANVQSPSPGEIVELFTIDLTDMGGTILYLTPGVMDGTAVVFDGNIYVPIPMETQGFTWNSKGSLPRPTIRISSVTSLVNAVIIEFNDLLGARVYRIRTFAEFLDNGSNPDPTSTFPIDIYQVERKVNQNKVFVEWELSTYIDQEGIQIPKRQVLRDTCTHTYRFWDSTLLEFKYDNVTCPYTGTNHFDVNDDPCNPPQDRCSKKLTGCRKRFGQNGVLPTRAFPGVARVR